MNAEAIAPPELQRSSCALTRPAPLSPTVIEKLPSLWVVLPTHARELLGALVAHHLAPLRAREEWLRVHIEDPARAAARQAARVLAGKDQAILRAERLADQAFHQAYQALLKRHRTRPPDAWARLAAGVPIAPPPVLPPPPGRLLTGRPGAFFDYHSARRAALEEQDVPIEYCI